MFYIIYKTTQTTTGRYYYGRHMTEDLNDGYRGSGRWVTISQRQVHPGDRASVSI